VFEKLISNIALALRQNHVPYIIIGGQAVLKYGIPRFTQDIDITLGIGIDKFFIMKKIIESLHFSILVPNPEEFIKETMVLPVKDRDTGIRIDFIFSFSLYEKEAITRGVAVNINNVEVRFASLEDLIIHKIIAGRPRDIEDVKSILTINPDYDILYIENWLKKFDNSLSENYFKTFQNVINSK